MRARNLELSLLILGYDIVDQTKLFGLVRIEYFSGIKKFLRFTYTNEHRRQKHSGRNPKIASRRMPEQCIWKSLEIQPVVK